MAHFDLDQRRLGLSGFGVREGQFESLQLGHHRPLFHQVLRKRVMIRASQRPASLLPDCADDLFSGPPSKSYPFRLVMLQVYPVPASLRYRQRSTEGSGKVELVVLTERTP